MKPCMYAALQEGTALLATTSLVAQEIAPGTHSRACLGPLCSNLNLGCCCARRLRVGCHRIAVWHKHPRRMLAQDLARKPWFAEPRPSQLCICVLTGRHCHVCSAGAGAARSRPVKCIRLLSRFLKRCGLPAGYATSKDHVYRLHGDGATAAWPGSKESRTTKELPAAALQARPHTLHGHHATLPCRKLQTPGLQQRAVLAHQHEFPGNDRCPLPCQGTPWGCETLLPPIHALSVLRREHMAAPLPKVLIAGGPHDPTGHLPGPAMKQQDACVQNCWPLLDEG